jgi:CheY-like chemotaxis protein
LNSDYVLAIISKRSRFCTLTLSKNIKNATISTLSHELKTVLNAIMGNLYLLEDLIRKSDLCIYNIALSSAHILSNKLDDLFSYIQIQDDNFKVHIKEFAVEKFIQHIGSICKWFAQQKNLMFSTLVEAEVPAIIKGDEPRLMQIILNIMMKAMEYIDFGEVNLKVKVANKKLITFQINAIGTGRHYGVLLEMSKFSSKSRKKQYKDLKDNPKRATENMEDMDLVIGKVIVEAIGLKIKYSIKERGHARLSLYLPNDFPEGNQKVMNSPRLITKVMSQNDFIMRKIDESLLYGKRTVVDTYLSPITEELTKTRIRDMHRFEELKDEYMEAEIPSESILPEGIIKGKYIFNVNTMSKCREESPLIRLYPATTREQSGNVMNSKDEIIKLKNLNRSTRNKREKRRRITMEGSAKLSSFSKLLTKAKCVEDLSSCNILIADDNMSNRFILKALLKKIGYNSIEAQDGLDAVDIVAKYITSGTIKDLLLIYMDLQMPIMNGIEATRSIIELCANAGVSSPPIVGVTANSLEEDRYKFEQAGINEFLSKPVDKTKINETVNRFIKRSYF